MPTTKMVAFFKAFYIANFFGGAFLVNAIPHFVNGSRVARSRLPSLLRPARGSLRLW